MSFIKDVFDQEDWKLQEGKVYRKSRMDNQWKEVRPDVEGKVHLWMDGVGGRGFSPKEIMEEMGISKHIFQNPHAINETVPTVDAILEALKNNPQNQAVRKQAEGDLIISGVSLTKINKDGSMRSVDPNSEEGQRVIKKHKSNEGDGKRSGVKLTRTTDEQKKEIVRLKGEGKNDSEISKLTGVKRPTVINYLNSLKPKG